MAVYGNGEVLVTVPYGVSDLVVQKFVYEKSAWIMRKINIFRQYDFGVDVYDKDNFAKYKNSAGILINKRILHFNRDGVFCINDVCVRKQKTRWGSCSQKGNLNFNYKILFLPKKLQDYIVVHELCHLKEFNHSQNFWKLVGSILPEYKDLRADLKKYSLLL